MTNIRRGTFAALDDSKQWQKYIAPLIRAQLKRPKSNENLRSYQLGSHTVVPHIQMKSHKWRSKFDRTKKLNLNEIRLESMF